MNADDYFAIQNLINRYFHYVDTGNFDDCGALFKEADLYYPTSQTTLSKDPEGVAKLMRSYVKLYGEAQTPLTRHHSGNIIIEPVSETDATAQCSAIIFQATKELSFKAIAEASYQDRFHKNDAGEWHFVFRETTLNFIGDMQHHLLQAVKQ